MLFRLSVNKERPVDTSPLNLLLSRLIVKLINYCIKISVMRFLHSLSDYGFKAWLDVCYR